MKGIEGLDLYRTAITDDGVMRLAKDLKKLKYIRCAALESRMTHSALEQLQTLPALI